jgi:hypothetical protein
MSRRPTITLRGRQALASGLPLYVESLGDGWIPAGPRARERAARMDDHAVLIYGVESAYGSTTATAQRAADALLASLESEISDLKRETAVAVDSLVTLTGAPSGAIWRVVDIARTDLCWGEFLTEALLESEGGRRFWHPVAALTVVHGAFRTLNPAAYREG